jgi:leucine dehydrogenase
MEPAPNEWDGEAIVVRNDRWTGAWIIIAIHSSRLGPATGGTRMMAYPDYEAALQDATRLAAGMTYKFAVHNFPRGGAKAVISVSDLLDTKSRRSLLLRYGTLIRQLNGMFYTGPDVGTSSEDMDVIAQTGAPYVHSRSTAEGGAGDSAPATALGVFSSLHATCELLYDEASLKGRRVLVQGMGSVGGQLIELLLADDAIVHFSEVDPITIRHFRDERRLTLVPPEEVFDAPCDIFVPCAMGNVLNAQTIPRLKCRAVVGAANNQLGAAGSAEMLDECGILYAPDFVVNAGGAIAITGMESLGWSVPQAEQEVRRIGETLKRVFTLARAEGITPEAAARRIAEANLR